jgi:predicted phosphodiesterase
MLEGRKRIDAICQTIDQKLGVKTVNLASGVKVLCGGYAGAVGDGYSPTAVESNGVQVASIRRLRTVLDGANQTTGYADKTLTAAVQRLCDGYAEDTPLYSFGVMSDLHIQYNTGLDDFKRALTYLRDKVPFTCVCGDLVSFASADNMAQYKSYVDSYAGDMPLYECAGNHETYPSQGVGGSLDEALWMETTGKEPYYSFEHEGDLFLFISLKTETTFVDGGITWLETQLEANKNRRCFVFQHLHDPRDDTADPSHKYSNMLGGEQGQAFLALMRQYTNAIWFHGHTHLTFGADLYPVSEKMGYRSVHIPSLQGPRFYDNKLDILENYYYDANGVQVWGAELAEGYIVDVYANKIVLRGIDFAAGSGKNQVALLLDEMYVMDTSVGATEGV